MNPLRIAHRRAPAGFTLIELLVVIAIISILIGLLLPAFEDAHKVANVVIERAVDEDLRDIGIAVVDCSEEAESTLRIIYEELAIAQINRELPPPDTLLTYAEQLRDNRGWVLLNLDALRDLYPSLNRRDRRLARRLYRPLAKLAVELEQEARLIETFLVKPPPDLP